ncbi:helix-turn-helix domain-containing protein [Nocardioides terrisoli]|uniref:helix-turn-helix domain-containing protein n=1 Tax=Nocardioides terrisoli TaxID=3388267 RepID=UPI00287B99E1|nr:helix-turn-helix domain-containing protein [Nocardioides marmorisolisilvae]
MSENEHGDVALLLRMEEAAERLGIARTMMYQLVRDGQVESVRVGRLRRIPVACLEDYIDDLRTRPAVAAPTSA